MQDHFIAKLALQPLSYPLPVDEEIKIFRGGNAKLHYEFQCSKVSFNRRVFLWENDHCLVFCIGANLASDCLERIWMLYRHNALEKVRAISGILSIVLIDKDAGQAHVLRDAVGIAPIYYSMQGSVLYLSNRQTLLMTCLSSPPQLNKSVIFEVLYQGFAMPGTTLIQDVILLSPYEMLSFDRVLRLHEIAYSFDAGIVFCEKKLMELAIQAFERVCKDEKEIHILSSGGLDSAFMVAMCAKILNKKVIQHTVSTHSESDECQYTQQLKSLFVTQNYYYEPSVAHIFERIDASVLKGEADVIGQLSVNAVLECDFIDLLSGSPAQVLFGDAAYAHSILFPQKNQSYGLGVFADKYGIASKAEILALMPTQTDGYLYYVQKNRHFLKKSMNVEEAFKCYSAAFSSCSGKIIAKYRPFFHQSSRVQYPFFDTEYAHYLYNLIATGCFNYRQAIQQLCINNNLLAEDFFLQKKQWMPSVWQSAEGIDALDVMSAAIIESNEKANYLFSDDVLRRLLSTRNGLAKERLVLPLFYLFRFCALFAIQI